jgi:hypothetical protein
LAEHFTCVQRHCAKIRRGHISRRHWASSFDKVLDSKDYSVRIWAKHDGEKLYFAFDVTDDVIYGIDTPRWLPNENPKAHELTRKGFPWFGDGAELLINASNQWLEADRTFNEGNGKSWQMVCNSTKSRKYGVGKGGVLEGEQRSNLNSWNTYCKWLKDGAMDAVVKIKKGGKGYVIEWMIKANPCLEVRDGVFWTPEMGTVRMGLNIATQDLDEREKGEGNWGNFAHEDWWAGNPKNRTWPKAWGSMYLHPETGAAYFAPASVSNSRPSYNAPLKTEFNNIEEKIAKSTVFYISVNGNDKNNGSMEKPFATIEKAKEQVRKLIKKGLRKDVLVFLRTGTYKISDTIIFTEQDSGNDNYSVIYAAYPGEKVVISGGVGINNWKKHGNGIYKAKVALDFRQLYVNGQRAIRARTPNGPDKFYRLKSWDIPNRKFAVNKSDFNITANPENVEMILQQRWASQVLRLKSVSYINDTAILLIQQPEDMVFTRPHPPRRPNQPYHFENSLEFLDQPGEWFLDTNSNTLYYKPRQTEDMKQVTAIVPAVETLLKIKGTLDKPVKNIKFYGLTFSHSTWTRPSSHGMLEMQAGLYNIKANEKNEQYVDRMPAAIYIAAAKNIRFERNVFTHLGAAGVDVHYAASENQFVGNVFSDISGNGLQLARFSEPDIESHVAYNPDDKRDICTDNIIENNFFVNNGVDYKGCLGIVCGWAKGVIIEYNEVTKMPYSGISVGYGWCDVANAMQDNKIRYNHVHNVSQLLADAGAIYTLSPQPGTEIGYNYIHDLPASKWAMGPINGIYLDEGSDGITINHNVLEKVGPRSLFRHRVGLNNVYFNNLIDTQVDGHTQIWQYKNSHMWIDTVKQKAGLEAAYRDIKNFK